MKINFFWQKDCPNQQPFFVSKMKIPIKWQIPLRPLNSVPASPDSLFNIILKYYKHLIEKRGLILFSFFVECYYRKKFDYMRRRLFNTRKSKMHNITYFVLHY